ncbi:MAG: hypothetical protein OXI27_06120 [Thaumarchaeota archaeon]|nr:hypothetical protein [Nitrososphaerota archaeon]
MRFFSGMKGDPRRGQLVSRDEVWAKIMGKKHYLFATMDDDTRYWLVG